MEANFAICGNWLVVLLFLVSGVRRNEPHGISFSRLREFDDS